jgi:hypothetical protein
MFSAASKTGSQPSVAANYIEDVFSTYLYTGNDGTTTVNNGIDLSTKGGLVWIKSRTNSAGSPFNHQLVDTVRGRFSGLQSNLANQENGNGLVGGNFLTTGFSVVSGQENINNSANTYCSWTFREQAKFFDIVTWTGDGVTTGRTLNHNLGSIPAMIWVKPTSTSGNWFVSGPAGKWLYLNTTAASDFANSTGGYIAAANSTSTTMTAMGNFGVTQVNASGVTYVAYLFASNAGGFGTTGTDNVISCGSVTTASGNGYTSVNLGYEPQYVLIKQTNTTSSWFILDVMRGMNQTQGVVLRADLNAAEVDFGTPAPIIPTATGFNVSNDQFYGGTFIYMAIRRPMKVPTTGTSVFNTIARTGTGSTVSVTGAGFHQTWL